MSTPKKYDDIIINEVSKKLSSLIEDMSTNEFVEMVSDEIFKQTGNEVDFQTVKDSIGDRIQPFFEKIIEYVTKDIK